MCVASRSASVIAVRRDFRRQFNVHLREVVEYERDSPKTFAPFSERKCFFLLTRTQ